MIQAMSRIDRESEDRILGNAIRRIGMHSIPPLIEVLNHDNQKVKILACHRLSQFGLQAKSPISVLEELFRWKTSWSKMLLAQRSRELRITTSNPSVSKIDGCRDCGTSPIVVVAVSYDYASEWTGFQKIPAENSSTLFPTFQLELECACLDEQPDTRMRTTYLTLILTLTITPPALADEPMAKTWDLTRPIPDNWTVIDGTWETRDGALQQRAAGRSRFIVLFDVQFVEGTIEVEIEAKQAGLASGIVAKWIDPDHHVFVRHGAYDYLTLGGRENFRAGPFGDFAISTPPTKPGQQLHLKIILRDQKLIYIVNDIVAAVANDPLTGKSGRPGLYTEVPVVFRKIKVTATR